MVRSLTMSLLGLSIILSVGVPVACFIYFRKKEKISWKPVFYGILVFVVFVLVLEALLNSYILQMNPQTSRWFSNHPYFLVLYGGLAAGVFEEMGRFFVYVYLLKKYREWKDGIAYGIGHGGIEAVLVGTLPGILSLVFAFLINSGGFEALLGTGMAEANNALMAVKEQLVNASPMIFALGGFERVFAFVLQLALSLLVLYAVRNKRMVFVLYAILIHAGVDFIAGLYQVLHLNILIVEGFMCIIAVLSFVFIIKSKAMFAQHAN